MELSSGRQEVNGFRECLVETAAAATPISVLEPSVKIFFRRMIFGNEWQIKLFIRFRVVSFLNLAKSRRTAGAESFQGAMSDERASSIRLRSSLDFSRCDRRRMPRGGIFDSDSSNNLMFLGSKTQL